MIPPETKLLIAEFGNASFDFGDIRDDDPGRNAAALRMAAAKEALVDHLEALLTRKENA